MKLAEKFALKLLQDSHLTTAQLHKEMPVTCRTVRQAMHELHHAGLVHIHSWALSSNNQYCAVWAAGAGEDAIKLQRERDPAPIRQRHPTVERIASIVASGEFNPFACLIGQMGNGR